MTHFVITPQQGGYIEGSISERFNIYNRQFDSVKSVYKEYCKHYYIHLTFVAVSYAMSKDGVHL